MPTCICLRDERKFGSIPKERSSFVLSFVYRHIFYLISLIAQKMTTINVCKQKTPILNLNLSQTVQIDIFRISCSVHIENNANFLNCFTIRNDKNLKSYQK